MYKPIPFYGGKNPELFEIERRCMDRQGAVIAHLNQKLPDGLVLDIGAGNGFSAERLTSPSRQVVALEPEALMIDLAKPLVWAPLVWAKGMAQAIPFHDNTFAAAYATWAFFFDGVPDIEQGIAEAKRVVRPGGVFVVVDNAGNDAFTSFASNNIASDASSWLDRGFSAEVIHTSFEFDSLAEANRLLSFYFGEAAVRDNRETVIGFDVAVYTCNISA